MDFSKTSNALTRTGESRASLEFLTMIWFKLGHFLIFLLSFLGFSRIVDFIDAFQNLPLTNEMLSFLGDECTENHLLSVDEVRLED